MGCETHVGDINPYKSQPGFIENQYRQFESP